MIIIELLSKYILLMSSSNFGYNHIMEEGNNTKNERISPKNVNVAQTLRDCLVKGIRPRLKGVMHYFSCEAVRTFCQMYHICFHEETVATSCIHLTSLLLRLKFSHYQCQAVIPLTK